VITEYPLPTPNSTPSGITAGPDGAIWFNENGGNRIVRMTIDGVITAQYPVPTPNSVMGQIITGSDGALWVTENNSNKIGRITTSGVLTEWVMPTRNSVPGGLTVGQDGALWFTEYQSNKIGRITTDGVITEYPVPTLAGGPWEIAVGPDGDLWYAEYVMNKIARVPDCALGLIASYATGTLTLGFSVGNTFPGTWVTRIRRNGVPVQQLWSVPTDTHVPLVTVTSHYALPPYGNCVSNFRAI
jgi:virginiamycin B lyase